MNLLPSCHHIRAVLCSVKRLCVWIAQPLQRLHSGSDSTLISCVISSHSHPLIPRRSASPSQTTFVTGRRRASRRGRRGLRSLGVWGGEGEVLHGARARAGWVREIGVGGRGQRRWARRLCEWHCICTSLFVSQLLHALIRRVVYVEARLFTVTICFDFGFECLPDQYFDPLLFR